MTDTLRFDVRCSRKSRMFHNHHSARFLKFALAVQLTAQAQTLPFRPEAQQRAEALLKQMTHRYSY
jgi:hypothetical protein